MVSLKQRYIDKEKKISQNPQSCLFFFNERIKKLREQVNPNIGGGGELRGSVRQRVFA
jgi:hypothetical protein